MKHENETQEENAIQGDAFYSGAKAYELDLIKRIEEKEKGLDDMDVEGHIWWNKFKEFIKSNDERYENS